MDRTSRRPYRLLAASLAAVTAALLAAPQAPRPASASGPAPQSGGTVTFALSSDPICIDPQQSDLTVSLNVGRQFVDSLVDEDPQSGKIVPWLASSWTVNANSTVFTFVLRDGITFSDGERLDAVAVKSSFDAIYALGPKAVVGSTYIPGYLGTKVLNAGSLQISFAQPNAGFLQAASTMTLGIEAPRTYKLSAAQRCQGGIIGSGPFVLTSYTPSQQIVLTRRDGYDWPSAVATHTGDAYLNKLIFDIVPTASVRSGSLESGQVDAAGDITKQDIPALTSSGFTTLTHDNPGTVSELVANNSAPILSDEAVRLAIVKGINRQQLVATLEPPTDRPATSILSSTTPYYTDLSSLLSYDPAAARTLLENDGWKVGSDGIRQKNGRRLTVTILNGQAGPTTVYQFVQENLAQIGVDLQIQTTTRGAMLAALAAGNYDLVPYGLTRGDPNAMLLDFSTKVGNLSHLKTQALQVYLDQLNATTDPVARQAAAANAQQYIVAHALAIPLYEQIQVVGVAPYVHGLRFEANTRLEFYDTWTSK